MVPYPKRFFLLPSERVLREAGMVPAWALEHIVASTLFAVVVWGGLAILVFALDAPNAAALWALLGAVAAIQLVLGAVYAWRRLVTTEYVVTDEAVYARRGRFLLNVGVAVLDRVTDLHVHTSLTGRLFGYSALDVRTAGGGVYLQGIRAAYEVRGVIQQSRHDFLARLLREGGREPGPATGARVGECQCPRCMTIFAVPDRRPLDVQCPSCQQKGMLFDEVAA